MRNRILVVLVVLTFIFVVPIKSASYTVPADSIKKKHKTTTTCILKQTAIYGAEQLGGLVGLSAGATCTYCAWIYIANWIGVIFEAYRMEVYYVSMPITTATTAVGTSCAGKFLGQKGSFTGAWIGAVLGTAAWAIPTGLKYLKEGEYTDAGPSALWYTSIGSVIGYNYREILKLDACSIGGMLLCGVISYALPYLPRYLSNIQL